MSIAAFYRTEVVFTRSYEYFKDGRKVKIWGDYAYSKANVQPWKEGEGIQQAGTGGFYFSEYSIVYIKNLPVPTPPDDIPEGEEVQLGAMLVWLDNKWWTVTGAQNWRRAGRGPKHYKLQIIQLPNQTPPADIPPIPDTSLRSVEEMSNNTYELEQAVVIFTLT